MANPIVTIEMESGAVMSGELYPELAPNTVNNFIALANSARRRAIILVSISCSGGVPPH